MRSKWTVILMTVVAILSLQGVAARTITYYSTNEAFIAYFNKEHRMRIMKEEDLPDVKELTYDYGLAKLAETLSCALTPPAGHRIFYVPSTDASVNYVYDELDAFMKIAHEYVDWGLRRLGNFPGVIETLSVNQTRVGCAYKDCKLTVTGGPRAGEYTYNAICVLGPKGTLTAEDLPFERPRAYWEGEVDSLDSFIERVNKNRMKVMKDNGLANVKELTFDKGLAKKAKTLSCSFIPPKGYRIFWGPRDGNDYEYSNSLIEKFLEIAHKDINQGVNYLGKYPGWVETLSVNQKKIGCAWKRCPMTLGRFERIYTAVCLLGPRDTLTAEDLPFQLHLHTRTSVFYDFKKYVDALNEERKKIMDDHGVKWVKLLRYDADLARKAADFPYWFNEYSYRVIRVPADAATAKTEYNILDTFLDIAHGDVDQAIHYTAHRPELVESLQVGQVSIGCAWKQITKGTSGDYDNYSALCVLGPMKELKAENFPFRQGPPLPEEE